MGRDDLHYLSLIYTGMARLAIDQEKNEKARKYYKLALKTDPYVPVRSEAEHFLHKNDDG
jgi:hypothetical protein